MTVSLIQAINRIRCRKVIDSRGNCSKADVYLFLPSRKKGEKFIDTIKSQMPNIQVNVLHDVPTERAKKDRSPYGRQIVEYLAKRPSGKYSVLEIQKKLDMSTRTLRRLLTKAEMPKNSFAKDLKLIHVRYEPAMGRGAKSYFVKGAES